MCVLLLIATLLSSGGSVVCSRRKDQSLEDLERPKPRDQKKFAAKPEIERSSEPGLKEQKTSFEVS